MSRTPYLDLNIPDKSSKGFVVTDVFEPNFTKLDQEAERVNLRKMSTEDNIEELKKASRYKLGDVVEVLGFHAKGDGSHHKRVAKSADDGSGEQGQNGIWWCIVHDGEINVSWFGAKGDGVTDDSDIFQSMFIFGVKTKVRSFIANCTNYKITKTIYLPFADNNHEGRVIDFKRAKLIGDAIDSKKTLFESAKLLSDGTILSTYEEKGQEKSLTVSVILKNFYAENFTYVAKLHNWIYGCKVLDIDVKNCLQVLHARRCFYLIVDNITPRGYYSGTDAELLNLPLYHFEDNTNIIEIKNLRGGAGSKKAMLQFTGALEAVKVYNCGIEGVDNGVIFKGEGYNIEFDSCYFEGLKSCLYFESSTINSVKLSNNWVYHISESVIDGTTNSNILGLIIDETNRIDLSNGTTKVFKTKIPYCLGEYRVRGKIKKQNEVVDLISFSKENNFPNAFNYKVNSVEYLDTSGLATIRAVSEFDSINNKGRFVGKFKDGYTNGEIPFCKIVKQDKNIRILTSIEFSETQLVFLSFKCSDYSAVRYFKGFIIGNSFVNVGGSDLNMTISSDENGLMVIDTQELPNGGVSANYGIFGGQIQLLG